MLTLANPSLDDLSNVNLSTGTTLNLPHTTTDTIANIVIDGIPYNFSRHFATRSYATTAIFDYIENF